MRNEIWKSIEGYENYEVSNTGMVRSTKYKKPRMMKLYLENSGYRTIALSQNGIRSTKYIHRLMAEAFIPNPEELPTVLFRDRDKNNVTLENLMWGTQEEALAHYHNTKDIIPTSQPDKPYQITKGTKKHEIYTLLLEDPSLGCRRLAELVNCHEMYANQIKRELTQKGFIKANAKPNNHNLQHVKENFDQPIKQVAKELDISISYVYNLRTKVRQEAK